MAALGMSAMGGISGARGAGGGRELGDATGGAGIRRFVLQFRHAYTTT